MAVLRTGVPRLDGALGGGLARSSVFACGGAGKTTIALEFFLQGPTSASEITLSETESVLREGAASDGWVLG